MLTDIENDVYGVRYDNNEFIIGSKPVHFTDNTIIVCSKQFRLSDGLRELMNKRIPSPIYTNEDLLDYKQILILTSGHKRTYNSESPVNANSSWKYRNIISKLFPPKRKKVYCPKEKTEPDMLQWADNSSTRFTTKEKSESGDENRSEPSIIDWDENTDPSTIVDMIRINRRLGLDYSIYVNILRDMGIIE